MAYLPPGPERPDQEALDRFWNEAKAALPGVDLPEIYDVRWIGLDRPTTDQVIELIESGDKRGTFTLPWICEQTGEPLPSAGNAIVLIDYDGNPRLLVRLTGIQKVSFGDIDESHTAIDGSPVRDLTVWKPMHTVYWNGQLEDFGMKVTEEMPVLIEPFELLHSAAAPGVS